MKEETRYEQEKDDGSWPDGSDDGGKYVMIQGDNGKLQKKYVKTGKTVYGYEIEILDGLSDDDYIAVPYGKNVKEGARTVREDDSDLYGGMY